MTDGACVAIGAAGSAVTAGAGEAAGAIGAASASTSPSSARRPLSAIGGVFRRLFGAGDRRRGEQHVVIGGRGSGGGRGNRGCGAFPACSGSSRQRNVRHPRNSALRGVSWSSPSRRPAQHRRSSPAITSQTSR
ncbi:hypothetical protein J4732_20650 [Serratia marcescens]|uniref:Uncharacterized protein n=1 Tax=Serratia marcescens TaxID=615 RepID=A0A939SP31_SERMA|nr:hypothetical protein [Serratia marcescens]